MLKELKLQQHEEEDDSQWEQFVRYMKLGLYTLLHELLQSQIFSAFIFKMLFLLETFQMFYYAIQPKIPFLWPTDFLGYIRDTIEYFQINALLSKGDHNVFYFLLVTFFLMLVGSSILMLVVMNLLLNKQTKSSTFVTYSVKVLASYALLQNTILMIPTFNIITATLICKSGSDIHIELTCYTGIHIIFVIIAVISLLIQFGQIILFAGFFIDLNPLSKIPFAAPQNNNNFLRILIKLFLPFYTVFDVEAKITSELIVVSTLYYLIILVHRYFTPSMYNKSVYNFVVLCEILLFDINVCLIINRYIEDDKIDSIGFFYFLVLIPCLMLFYYFLIIYRDNQYIQYTPKQLHKDYQVDMFLSYLIHLIQNIDQASSRVKLEGVLKNHSLQCTRKDKCRCQITLTEEENGDENVTQRKWYLFIQALIEDALEKFPKSSRLHLISSYIQQEKLKNKFKSFYELIYTEENKPTIQEEFSIFSFKQIIEEELIETDQKSSENKGLDINAIIIFQNIYEEFQEKITDTVHQYLEFWRELNEDNPDMQKLHSLGKKITMSIEITNQIFQELYELNPNHILCLQKYGFFLKDVINDEQEAQRIIDKMHQVLKSQQMNQQFVANEKVKYGENSNTTIITISGNKGDSERAIITHCTSEIEQLLQFKVNELTEKNIGMIMPKIYADNHNQFIDNFLATSQETVMGKDRLVMAINAQGFMVPCNIMIKVFPNLEDGIQIVGFLNEKSQQGMINKQETDNKKGNSNNEHKQSLNNTIYYILYNQINYTVLGITKNCHERLGVPPALIYGNQTNNQDFGTENIFKDLDNQTKQEELRSPSGAIIQIDTNEMFQNFMLDDNLDQSDSEEDDDNNNQKEDDEQLLINKNLDQNFQKVSALTNKNLQDQNQTLKQQKKQTKKKEKQFQVRAFIEYEKQYASNLNLVILKFYEVNDQDGSRLYKNTDHNQNEQEFQQDLEDIEEDLQDEDDDQNNEQKQKQQQNQNDNINEDDRSIKDFKISISEKTVPRQIKILTRIMYFLLLIVTGISILEQQLKAIQFSEIKDGIKALKYVYLRHHTMVDINYYTRKLSMLANGFYPNLTDDEISTQTSDFQSILLNKVDNLQYIQLNITQSDLQAGDKIEDAKKYEIEFLLQNGMVTSQSNIISEAMFSYITSSSSLAKSSLSTYEYDSNLVDGVGLYTYNEQDTLQYINNNGEQVTVFVDSTEKNFYYVIQNGLYTLRKGSEDIAQKFYELYKDEINTFQTQFIILLVTVILCLTFAQCFLVPIVFKVHKTNNRVLSLFGIIPTNEIQYLIYKCEWYIDEHLKFSIQDEDDNGNNNEDKNEKKKKQQEFKNQYILNTQQNQKLNESLQPMNGNKINNTIEMNPKIMIKQDEGDKIDKADEQQNQDEEKKKNSLQNKIEEIQKIKLEDIKDDDQDQNDERENKLLSTKDTNNRFKIICQFIVICILFFTYFIVGFYVELGFLDKIDITYDHQQLIYKRPILLNFNIMFTLENIVLGYPQSEVGTSDLRAHFTEQVYENEGLILESYQKIYPNVYDSYIENFKQNNQGNLCLNSIFKPAQQQTCTTVSQSMLTKGIRTSNIALIENTRNILSLFDDTVQDKQSKIDAVNSQSYVNVENMKEYLIPVMENLNEDFVLVVQDYIDQQSNYEIIKCIVFIILLFIAFCIVWRPFLTGLNNKIWSTKGMLNMIPLEIILRHQKLKTTLLSGEIIKAVK